MAFDSLLIGILRIFMWRYKINCPILKEKYHGILCFRRIYRHCCILSNTCSCTNFYCFRTCRRSRYERVILEWQEMRSIPKGAARTHGIEAHNPSPHTALPWHTHPYPNAGDVLSGELTIEENASGVKHTFRTGEEFTESVNDVHRGISGDQSTVLVITYSGVHGVPTFVAADGTLEY